MIKIDWPHVNVTLMNKLSKELYVEVKNRIFTKFSFFCVWRAGRTISYQEKSGAKRFIWRNTRFKRTQTLPYLYNADWWDTIGNLKPRRDLGILRTELSVIKYTKKCGTSTPDRGDGVGITTWMRRTSLQGPRQNRPEYKALH